MSKAMYRFPYRHCWANAVVTLPRAAFKSMEDSLNREAGVSPDNHTTFWVECDEDCYWPKAEPRFSKGFFITFHDLVVYLGPTARKGECWGKEEDAAVDDFGLADLIA